MSYRVPFRINPCAERASACQARACIGAEGFIHSGESVQIDCVYVCKTNSISSYLQTTEPTPPRRPTVSATTAKSAGAPPRSPAPVSTEDRSVTRWGRRFVRRPRRAKSDCPATRVSLVRKTDEVLVNVGKMLWHDEVLHQKETHTPVPKATTAGKVTSRPKKQINSASTQPLCSESRHGLDYAH